MVSTSLMLSIGFEGVSIHTSRVLSVSACAHDFGVRHVDERVAHAHRADDVAQLLGGAVIDLDRRDHVIARTQQAEDRERCAGAGRICGRVRAAFERRDALLERAAARIVGTDVGIAARELAVDVALVRRAQVHGRRDFAGRWLDVAAHAHRYRLDLHVRLRLARSSLRQCNCVRGSVSCAGHACERCDNRCGGRSRWGGPGLKISNGSCAFTGSSGASSASAGYSSRCSWCSHSPASSAAGRSATHARTATGPDRIRALRT